MRAWGVRATNESARLELTAFVELCEHDGDDAKDRQALVALACQNRPAPF
jgi:hypothetical protein